MNPAKRSALVWLGLVLASGCSVKSLPSGTPPPEYEKRTLEPWPPVPDGGTGDAAESIAPTDPEPSLGSSDGGSFDGAAPP